MKTPIYDQCLVRYCPSAPLEAGHRVSTEFASDFYETLMKDAYFAGLFDGEGCIQISRSLVKRGLKNPVYQIRAEIGMIHREVLDEISAFYGPGSVYGPYMGKKSLSPWFRWSIGGRRVELVLRRFLPFSRIKRAEIEVALAFQEHVRTTPHGGRHQVTEASLRYREECRLKLQALKRRFRIHQSLGSPLP